MRLRELESWLQQASGFEDPKMELEQYATSPKIAGRYRTTAGNFTCRWGGCVCQPRDVGPHDWARADFLDLTRNFQETPFWGAIRPLLVDGGTSDPSMPSLAPIMPGHSSPLPYSAGPDVC